MNEQNSRTKNTTRNIVVGYAGNIVTMLLHFVSRTIFIYTIGVSYLGINGLFTSVLGILSLTELGIGTAINFSLYKPVAENNIPKIQALMKLYKKAYYIIALIVTLVGLALIPAIPYLINDAKNIPNIFIYYIIFLFNIVSSYFVSYKYGLVNAEQKGYIISMFTSGFAIAVTLTQCIVLLAFENYLVYLVSQAIVQLIEKIVIALYLRKRYPYLNEKNVEKLPQEETDKIKKNVFALIIHKLGETSIYQTDNIIISAFISVTLVGIISNYNLIITSVTTFVNIIFNSVTSSAGNLIATESKLRQKEIFDIYNFLGFWLFGFCCVCYYVLFTPFVSLWVGEELLVDEFSLILIIVSQYLTGQRLTINNMKSAAGIYNQDKYVSLIQGVINLVVSIVLVQFMGLPGIYIGTVVSGLYANIYRPIVVYREMFNEGPKPYFIRFAIYLVVTVGVACLAKFALTPIVSNLNWFTFILLAFCCVVLTNACFALIFFKCKEFKGIWARVKGLLKKRRVKSHE